MKETNVKYKYGLVLSGGAVRGFAHLGAIKALHDNGIEPEVISGTSAGAIVGVFYADGFSPDEIFHIFSEKKLFEYMKLIFKRNGLLDISKLKTVLSSHLHAKTFDQLQKELYVTVTNFESGKAEYLNQGKLAESVIGSSSIPVLFKPLKYNNKIYVDGGLTDNMPLTPIIDLCNKIIGVHVNPIGQDTEVDRLHKIAIRSFHMSIASDINHKKDKLTVFIEPEELRDYSYFDVSKSKEMYDLGYHETQKEIKKLNE